MHTAKAWRNIWECYCTRWAGNQILWIMLVPCNNKKIDFQNMSLGYNIHWLFLHIIYLQSILTGNSQSIIVDDMDSCFYSKSKATIYLVALSNQFRNFRERQSDVITTDRSKSTPGYFCFVCVLFFFTLLCFVFLRSNFFAIFNQI